MPISAELAAAIELARELFAGLGSISIRRLFGGAGIYCGGKIFALIYEGDIYLKAGEEFGSALKAEGSIQFEWYSEKRGKLMHMGYWRLPDRALDSGDEAVALARQALRPAGNKK